MLNTTKIKVITGNNMMEEFYVHTYIISHEDNVKLIYLRKTDDIDPESMSDELDNFIESSIRNKFPQMEKNDIEVIRDSETAQEFQELLLNDKHLTAVFSANTTRSSYTPPMCDRVIASILVPCDVESTNYDHIGTITPIDAKKEKEVFGANEKNWPMILHHCPLLNGIDCKICRENNVLYFVYHIASEYKVYASVDTNSKKVDISIEGEQVFETLINAYNDKLNKGSLNTLIMNKEKKLFCEAKNLLIDNLKSFNAECNIIQDCITYLENAEEL